MGTRWALAAPSRLLSLLCVLPKCLRKPPFLQALIAVAQLAGGDYDVAGAERVGDILALGAVRCLLKGRQVGGGQLRRSC